MRKIIGLMSILTVMSYAVNCMVVNVNEDDSLNVRAGAGVKNRAIGVLDYNAKNVEVIECKLSDKGSNWCHINYNAGEYGINGWVNANYLVSTDESVDLNSMVSTNTQSKSTVQNIQVYNESTNLVVATDELNEAIELYYYKENKEKEALSLFIKLSNHDNILATAQVAKMYYLGVGVEQDKQLALSVIADENIIKSLKESAENGDAFAQYLYGYYFEEGISVEKNYQKALYWYKKAAAQGNAIAQNNIGGMYNDGEGVEKDTDKAKDWFEKAVKSHKPYPMAEYNLGVIYRDLHKANKAFPWFRKASSGHQKYAAREAGKLLEEKAKKRGDSIKWYKRALSYYKRAYQYGNEKAKKDIERVEEFIGKEKVNEYCQKPIPSNDQEYKYKLQIYYDCLDGRDSSIIKIEE